MTDHDTVHVLFAGNADYVQHATVAIRSLLETHAHIRFDIAFVARGVSDALAAKMQASLAEFRLSQLRLCTPPPETADLLERAIYSTDMYQRYFIDRFFPQHATRALYLDSDLVVTGDLSALFKFDLRGAPLAAVPIGWSERMAVFNRPADTPYFNSGVLLVDLVQWRRDNFGPRLARTTDAFSAYLRDPDQDILNLCFEGRWAALPPQYNVLRPIFQGADYIGMDGPERRAVMNDARIVHFNGAVKPWHFGDNHPEKMRYWDSLSRTAFKAYKAPDDTLLMRLREVLRPLLPTFVKKRLRPAVTPPQLPPRLPVGEKITLLD